LALDVGYSLNWIRNVRPAAAAVNLLSMMSGVTGRLRPVRAMADTAAQKARLSPRRARPLPSARGVLLRDAMPAESRDAALVLNGAYPLRPQWDPQSLDWFIGQASQKRKYGLPSWRIGETRSGKLAAAYVYFGRPGGIGWLLQALC